MNVMAIYMVVAFISFVTTVVGLSVFLDMGAGDSVKLGHRDIPRIIYNISSI